MPLINMPDYAGLTDWRKVQSTGTYVGLYVNEDAGLDSSDGEYPWSTICEAHGGVISHATLTAARSWLTHPDEWCQGCMDKEPPNDDYAERIEEWKTARKATAS